MAATSWSHPLNGPDLLVVTNAWNVDANALRSLYMFQFHRILTLCIRSCLLQQWFV
jgi:hypothetical protein